MSYDITGRMHERRSAAMYRAQEEMEDAARLEFLRALDGAPFEVTDWEAQFIAGFIAESRGFTERQRQVVDELQKNYAHRLPAAGGSKTASDRLPPAEPGKCHWLFSAGEGKPQRRCGQPATTTRHNGKMELCAGHAEERDRVLRQMAERRNKH